jgi:AraC-like DNA-binding protein
MALAEGPSRPGEQPQPAAPARLIISTDALPERHRIPFFREEMSRILLVEMSPLSEGPPRFSMDFTQAGPTGFALMQGTAARHRRTRSHLSDANEDFTFVIFNKGWQSTEHNRHTGNTLEGGGFMFNAMLPSLSDIPEAAEIFALRIGHDALKAVVRHPEDNAGMHLAADMPGMALLKGYLRAFHAARDTLTPALTHSFGLHVVDLVATILGTTRDGAARAEAGGIKAARLRAVLAAIATRAEDPAFGIEALASQLAVSSRTIQLLLEETGATFSEHLLEQRLRRAWRLLSDPQRHDLKIASIAFECGFNDLGTFYRTFRRRFGETPTAVRGAAAAPPPSDGAAGETGLAGRLAGLAGGNGSL